MAREKLSAPRSIGRSLNFTAGRMNALCQSLLDPYDISLPQWVILSCLWREGALTVGALAEIAGTGLPAMSRIVDRMAQRGLVERQRDDADRRLTVVTLTRKGQELDHLSDFHERINTLILSGFSQDERDLAFALLARMQTNAEGPHDAE